MYERTDRACFASLPKLCFFFQRRCFVTGRFPVLSVSEFVKLEWASTYAHGVGPCPTKSETSAKPCIL